MGRIRKIEDKAYRYIKDQITTDNWREGKQIKELEIADALEISRTPIRNAFTRLEADGFVTISPNKGVFVAKPVVDVKGVKERLYFLEALLQHVLYTLELSETRIETEHYTAIVSDMEKHLTIRSDTFEITERQFWESILIHHDNAYMNESIMQTLNSLLSSNEYARDIFKDSRTVKLSHYKTLSNLISQHDYVYARREVRILLNQLLINLIQGVD